MSDKKIEIDTWKLGLTPGFEDQIRVLPSEEEAKDLQQKWDETWKSIWTDVDSGKVRTISESELGIMKKTLLGGVMQLCPECAEPCFKRGCSVFPGLDNEGNILCQTKVEKKNNSGT